ncbi:hypothetical protein [Motilimonas eburnea]|uniref:hypothetical protein n=1 Tax=Motilimonas eburnea TaxID=1737488 RepID=UPI001E45BBEE|nr:hypothetical protein [Motilimonas eburnea]MCE2572814.1 hypothetical protein [Motilimonas eburnea]
MTDVYGCVVVQASAEVVASFNQHRDTGLEQLVAFAGAEQSINDDCDVFFDQLEIKGDSGLFHFSRPYWVATVKRLAKTATGIGLYLRARDEYGGEYYFAQNPQGERVAFFAGGPEADFDSEEGDMVDDSQMQQWLAVIPDTIQADFPFLITFEDIE